MFGELGTVELHVFGVLVGGWRIRPDGGASDQIDCFPVPLIRNHKAIDERQDTAVGDLLLVESLFLEVFAGVVRPADTEVGNRLIRKTSSVQIVDVFFPEPSMPVGRGKIEDP